MSSSRLRPLAAIGAAAVFALTGLPRTADAIPAFSRKYATSCATCHTMFPKLNAFGRAFRNHGYRMPGGDDDYLKDENIKLGAEPWKRLWPEAIWPSDIPYLPPVTFIIENEFEYSPEAAVKTDFRTPSDIAMLTGGSLGDSMSFFGRVNLVAPGAELHVHRFFGQFNGMFGTSLLNLRIGQMEPRAVPFSSNQRLAKADYLLNSATMPLDTWVDYLQGLAADDDDDHGDGGHTEMATGSATAADGHGDMDMGRTDVRASLIGVGGHMHGGGFSLGTTQMGVELWGATGGMGGKGGLEYAIGMVNGNGSGTFAATGSNDNNNNKDLYWRASYKFGGMSVMGDPESAPAATNNWKDNSVRVGVFGYHGTAPFSFTPPVHVDEDADGHDEHGDLRLGSPLLADDHEEPTTMESLLVDEKFRRIGADLDIWLGDLNVFGAYLWGRTKMDPVLLEGAHVDYKAALAQADYMVYPWLSAALRYERVEYDEAFGVVTRWVPHVTALLRANVKLSAEAALYSDDAFNDRYRFWFNFAF